MQDNAFLRNGSSIYERNTQRHMGAAAGAAGGGYQTSYVFHLENPVRFREEIKVTIEHGHGNHLANEMASVAYWYAQKPTKVARPPAVSKRMGVLRDNMGHWIENKRAQCAGAPVPRNAEMKAMKKQWAREHGGR